MKRKKNESLEESLLSLTESLYEFTKKLETLVNNMDKAGMLKGNEDGKEC